MTLEDIGKIRGSVIAASAATPSYNDLFFKESINKIAKESPETNVSDAVKTAEEEAEVKAKFAYTQDKIFYRRLLYCLTIIIALVIIGSIFLTYSGKTMSDGIIAIGSGAVGALIGLFSNKG